MSSDFDPAGVRELDVRAVLEAGREPLPLILAAADALPPGGVLHLRSPFEPVPLFRVMAGRGFDGRSQEFGEGDWSSWFWRHAEPPAPPAAVRDNEFPPPAGVIDLRTLPPPEPLLWILRWTSARQGDAALRVMLPFYPTPLEDLLAASRWRVTLEEEREDGVVVRIEKR